MRYKRQALKAEAKAQEALALYEEMNRNFLKATELDKGEYSLNDNFFYVSDVYLDYDWEIADTTVLYGTIIVNGSDIGVKFTNDTKYIIQLKDGTVRYQGLWDGIDRTWLLQNNAYYRLSCEFSRSSYKTRFVGISPEDISYIKISNISLCQYPYGNVIKDNVELEVYRAD